MIQRIQHLFLFLNFLLACYFATMPIIEIQNTFNGHSSVQYITASAHNMKIDEGSLIERSNYIVPLILIGLIGLLSFVSIFQYRNRKIQRNTCFLNYILIALFVVSIIRIWMGVEDVDVLEITVLSWLNAALMILMLLFNYIAVGGINRDEALVRSADRLR